MRWRPRRPTSATSETRGGLTSSHLRGRGGAATRPSARSRLFHCAADVAAVEVATSVREAARDVPFPSTRDKTSAMASRRRVAQVLAIMHVADLIAGQTLPQFGDDHLDHLGVPRWLRPALPTTKAAAVVALVVTRGHPRPRSVVGAALVSYYSAAVTFHVLSNDGAAQAAPAAAFGVLAAAIV